MHTKNGGNILDVCIEQFRPVTRYEHSIVEKLRSLSGATYEEADEAVRRTLAYRSLADSLHRHQTRLERARDRAVESLMDLRANMPAASPNPVETENAKSNSRVRRRLALRPEGHAAADIRSSGVSF
jgi:hypothetical protein